MDDWLLSPTSGESSLPNPVSLPGHCKWPDIKLAEKLPHLHSSSRVWTCRNTWKYWLYSSMYIMVKWRNTCYLGPNNMPGNAGFRPINTNITSSCLEVSVGVQGYHLPLHIKLESVPILSYMSISWPLWKEQMMVNLKLLFYQIELI